MNLGQLASKARDLVQRRGGTDSLKEDAQELRDIASGQGSPGDKAKATAEAVKDPGGGEARPAAPAQATPRPTGDAATGEDVEAETDPRPGRRATRRRAGRRRRR